ncbi:hypothetical protein [Ruania halotolerans]|uniref:hypothetical protein n=1 Tax=Ruania halotolerans TaxID=2897773 RepID=UPI001E32ACE2|nr:hypothetical protein [Ruania halotolerans]UFU07151.1 hypothetical protein LQF10_03290 [Ruania halotolerans]
MFALSGCTQGDPASSRESEEPAGAVMADYPWYASAEELIAASSLVIEGHVRGSWEDDVDLLTGPSGDDPEMNPCAGVPDCAAESGVMPVLIYEVAVSRTWSGADEQTVLVHTPRGTASDGPDLTVGEEYLLFLAGDASIAHPLNPDQAAYQVVGDIYVPTSEANTVTVALAALTG